MWWWQTGKAVWRHVFKERKENRHQETARKNLLRRKQSENGPGAERVSGRMDNTAVFEVMKKALSH
jgi:alkaline phosphatase